MITLYALKQSRSQRIVWLLEALGVPYEVKNFEREPQTRAAPPIFKTLHPLGKAPILTDGETVIAESAAIVEYLIERYGKGAFIPNAGSPAYVQYKQWLHYAEGSIMPNFTLKLIAGDSPKADYIHHQLSLHLNYIEQYLADKKWFCGDQLTGADVMMSFPLQVAQFLLPEEAYPNIARYVEQVEQNEHYQRAVAKVGSLDLDKL